MKIENPFLGKIFNYFDAPIRYIYCRFGFLSKVLNKLMFWKLYTSNFKALDEKFIELETILNKHKIDIKDKVVLELGPGNSYINAYNFLMNGAKKVILVDKFPRVIEGEKQKEFLSNELNFIKEKYKVQNLDFVENGLIDSNKIQVIASDITEVNDLEEIDFVYSISVFEHIKDVKENIEKLSQIVKKGGLMFHKIDFRDHYNFNRPFLFYKYTDKQWFNYYTKEGLSFTNRIRYGDFIEMFSDANFKIIEEEKSHFPMNETKIDSTFQGRDDLDIGILKILVEKK